MRMSAGAVVCLVLVCLSCGGGSSGGGSPVAPVPTPPSPAPPATWSLGGTIVDAVSGTPVAGATVEFAGQSALTTDGQGAWELRGTTFQSATLPVRILAAGYLTRETFVGWQSAGRSGIAISLIADRAPFSLTFYRAMVRNGLESVEVLEPLRRWSSNPNFYVNTFNPKTGLALEQHEIDLVVQSLRVSVPQLSGGLLEAGAIETGNGPRDARIGYIDVKFVYEPEGTYCGQAYVGANPGEITINYDRCASVCGSLKVTPETIAHEVGHAMGFWHTPGEGIMSPMQGNSCRNVQFSEAERLHARVAYMRPRGNLDEDRDPSGFAAALAPGNAPLLRCTR